MDENVKKFKIIRNAVIVICVIIILSSIRLQIIEGAKYNRLSENNRIRQKSVAAPRGKIFDRYGVEIANTRPGFYVSAIQSVIDESTLAELMRILDIDVAIIQERFKLQKNPFLPVKIAHDISYAQLSVLEESWDRMKGIEVGVEPLRNYPYDDLFAHVVGYVGEITQEEMIERQEYAIDDYLGRMGLEEYYEESLKGVDGIEYVEVDAWGKEVGTISEKRPIPAMYGNDLHTTLDCSLTQAVALYLEEYEKAACVCIDPRTGDVLVLYSKPGFDPNRFVHGIDEQEWQLLNIAPDAPMYNRATMSCYPCGSTFKAFVALAALDASMITEHKTFKPCQGYYRLGNRIFRCWKKHWRLDLTHAIIHSCDCYFYQLGRLVGIDTLHAKIREVGFGRLTTIDIPNEKSGLLPDRSWYERRYGKYWTEGHILNFSIGQGDILVTPLQLACAFTLFANQGRIPTPHCIQQDENTFHDTHFSQEAIALVAKGLQGVVSSGTGMLARVDGIAVCGKTGTAQNPHGDDHSLFVGYAPADDPEILVCVIVENAGHGGSVAAPIAGKIMRLFFQSQESRKHAKAN
ncbi:MAG: penicillin-binding protein 2 [candidate division WOR-3 bacterium]|nr:MAG: penicillin-binding protein 2 [candidate division WOR-3 bacterium]